MGLLSSPDTMIHQQLCVTRTHSIVSHFNLPYNIVNSNEDGYQICAFELQEIQHS